jgi:hypothetical protein
VRLGAYFRKTTYDAISSQALDCVTTLSLDVELKNDWNERKSQDASRTHPAPIPPINSHPTRVRQERDDNRSGVDHCSVDMDRESRTVSVISHLT